MCGIAGIINSEKTATSKLNDIFKDMLIVTQLRGMDATGVYQQDSRRDLQSYKKAVDASTFVQLPKALKIIAASFNAPVSIAHCRAATTGGTKDLVAHPFIHETTDNVPDFGFVHNGTLDVWNSKDFKSDTEFLANQVFEKGGAAFDALKGSWACVWTDTATDTTYIARNDKRPLHYAFVKNKDIMLIASEVGTLSWLADRNNVELDDDAIYEFEDHNLYQIPNDNCRGFTKSLIKKVPEEKPYKNPYYNARYYGKGREELLLELETLMCKTLKILPTTAAVSISPGQEDKPFTLSTSQEEQDDLQAYGIYEPVRLEVVPVMYDDAKSEMLFVVLKDHDAYYINTEDVVAIRNVTASYAKYLNHFKELYVWVSGYDDKSGSLIAERPDPTCLKMSTKHNNLSLVA